MDQVIILILWNFFSTSSLNNVCSLKIVSVSIDISTSAYLGNTTVHRFKHPNLSYLQPRTDVILLNLGSEVALRILDISVV